MKLSSLGIGGDVLQLIWSFLTGRTMSVLIDGYVGSGRSVTSGVSQGSVLGPLLFLIYVNFLMDSVTCPWVAFADDFKLWFVSRRDSGPLLLQNDIDRTMSISRSWNLSLNPGKCVIMHFGRGTADDVHIGVGHC